jgi:hypothetical protein
MAAEARSSGFALRVYREWINLRCQWLYKARISCSYDRSLGIKPPVAVLFLYAILLPVNALRLGQFYRLVREMRRVPRRDLAIQSLLPYMAHRKFGATGPTAEQVR